MGWDQARDMARNEPTHPPPQGAALGARPAAGDAKMNHKDVSSYLWIYEISLNPYPPP